MFDWGEITPTSELSTWNRDSIDSKLRVHFLVVNFPHFDGSTPPVCSTILWRLPVSPVSPAATDRRRGVFRRRAKCWRRGGPGVVGTSNSRWIPLMWIKKAKRATDYRIRDYELDSAWSLGAVNTQDFQDFCQIMIPGMEKTDRTTNQIWENFQLYLKIGSINHPNVIFS